MIVPDPWTGAMPNKLLAEMKSFQLRANLQKHSQKTGTVAGETAMNHILFERLDTRKDFTNMLTMLTSTKDHYHDSGEHLAWHVRNAKCLGWNALNEDDGIRFLIDILPIAGATTVKIEGLGARTELNGMQATILGLCSDCRCEVCTDSGEQVRVKPCNLEVVD